jgi:predicted O-methyltransferase YrrM
MPNDPASWKRYPRWHPVRIVRSLWTQVGEIRDRWRFADRALPPAPVDGLPPAPAFDRQDTAVTPEQMRYLLHAVRSTEHLTGTVVVEVGSSRGVTTACLARATTRKVIAVDPFVQREAAAFEAAFRGRIAGLSNVIHERKTSGEAVQDWPHGPVGMVFIDADHTYAAAAHDIRVWGALLAPGGIMALHDTDNRRCPGARRAAFEVRNRYRLVGHTDNLVLLGN